MQGPNPQEFYPGKATDRTLAQKIKDTYDDVEKGTRSYKVASIQNGTVHLDCQLIVKNLVRKKRPTQVTAFVIDLVGKCVEGIQMNWVKYLVLMGLKSLDSTLGTRPATEAQLGSVAFEMEWFSKSCDPTNLSMGFAFSCEGSPFR
jgi:hypothetical protein